MSNKLLSIVIVSYNNQAVLEDCLRSIRETNDIGEALEVIVVEQSPTDDIYRFLTEHYPDIITLRAENKGFGAGNNRGVEVATGRYLLLLNPDTVIVDPVFAFAVKSFEENAELGLFGVKLLNADRTSGSSFENIYPYGLLRKLRYKLCEKLDCFIEGKMYIQGADLFVRRELFTEVGCFDEAIFMYGEEPDLCTRIRKAGYRIAYFKDYRIVHLQGACSSDKLRAVYEKQLASFSYLCEKNAVSPKKYFAAERRLQRLKRLLLTLCFKKNSEGCQNAEARIAALNSFLKK